MSTYDVRSNKEEVIDEIVFAESEDERGRWQASYIHQYSPDDANTKRIVVSDSYDGVIINSKEHALNLIKALNKAI